MELFSQQIFTILTTPPGNLIYHLVLAFSVIATLQAILAVKHGDLSIDTNRIIIGLIIILLGQLTLFISSGLTWQGMANPHTLLPPMDRAITSISLLWMIWLWAFPKRSILADITTVTISISIILLFLLTLLFWNNSVNLTSFNTSRIDAGWQIFTIFLSISGLILLAITRPERWEVGGIIASLFLAGSVIHLFWEQTSGDFSGALRLAQLCAYPLLPSLTQRLRLGGSTQKTVNEEQPPESRQYAKDQRAFYALLQLAMVEDPSKICHSMARAIAQTMIADMCYLVRVPDGQSEITIKCGFDMLREEDLSESILQKEQIPVLASALQRGKPLRLNGDNQTTPDLKNLATSIGLEKPGNLLQVPLSMDDQIWGGIIMLSSYSNRVWTLEDQTFLMTATKTIAKILGRAEKSVEKPVPSPDISAYSLRIENLETENKNLTEKITQLQSDQPGSAHFQDLFAVQKDLQAIINNLQTENDQLKAELTVKTDELAQPSTKEGKQQQAELDKALENIAHLENVLAGANSRILSMEMQTGTTIPETGSEQHEVIVSIAQELRQPLASVTGYTELLMSESVGSLGALQRKFIERVKSSAERMNSLLDDLIRIMNLEYGAVKLQPKTIDINNVIDDAIIDTVAQIKEKNITLRVDLPESIPLVCTDPDALQQIVVHLLQNAGSATPPESTVDMRVQLDQADDQHTYLFLQVTDWGGGISQDDLPRVFSRQYRADNPLIQGLGDTGVGLSIARTLTEAQGGRIWVDSETGKSSTFSMLLPIEPEQKASPEAIMSE